MMLRLIPWILTLVLYSPVFYALYKSRWEAIDYTHAYFILPLSLVILWSKRTKLIDSSKKPCSTRPLAAAGLLLVTVSLLLFILGWRGDYLVIQTFSLIPLLCGMILYLYNKETFRQAIFPIFYLLLLVPIPIGVLDNITLPMRYIASVVSAYLLNLMGYDVIREGLLIQMGSQDIYMGAPCSGFRSLITMIALGLVYIYFSRGSALKNGTLFISIFPLAFVGNFIRIIALCLITYYFGSEAGQGFFHNFSGIVVFLIIVLGLIGLDKILEGKFQKS